MVCTMLPILSLFLGIAAAANFSTRCSNIVVVDNAITASCKNRDGDMVCSVLDLTTCIRANYGRLEGVSDDLPIGDEAPSFAEVCTGCSNNESTTDFFIDGGTSMIHCSCSTGFGSNIMTSMIDLDTIVNNSDGFLECYGEMAMPCED